MKEINYKRIFNNREERLGIIRHLSFIPDSIYLRIVYRIKTGKRLNLNKPTGFNEKENWLKINDIHSEYCDYVDKVKVRGIVERIIGPGHFFPLLGTWKSFKEINFNELPNEFVLKCNHDSGSVKIIRDKTQINLSDLDTFFTKRLSLNPYVLGREYPYKDVEPCILAEKLMTSKNGINDYKFFCFDGVPKIMFIATDRFNGDTKFDWYDMDFNHLDITNIHPQSGLSIAKPQCFEEMKEIAAKCSKGIRFVRIDLYEIDGKVYFGEYTFFHGGGFWLFKPDHWEYDLGNMIHLP